MMTLTFDQVTHSYERDGVRLPSVTQICKVAEEKEYPDGAARRGTVVHLACQFLDEDDLLESAVPEAIRGYLDAYRKFLAETGWTWTGIEVRMAHETLNYAGQIDRISQASIVDLKSGAEEDWHPLQLAGYLGMFKQPMSMERYALYLRADGTYSLKNYPRKDFPRDWAVFQSCLNIYNWRARHGNGNGAIA